jgi:DNA mismatch repair ATPase MutS
VLLTRVGGFYELYFDHAEEYGPLLNLKIAQKKTSAGPVPMVLFRARTMPPSRCPLVF